MSNANQIQLAGEFRREEDIAGGTIKPGHLIEVYNDAGTKKVRVHSTVGGFAERAFAVEDALQGNTIDDNYSAADRVSYNIAAPGSVIQAWLKAGENVVKGDKLISGGDGTLIENGSEGSNDTVEQIIAIAEEAVDLSGMGAEDTRIDVRVL